MHPDNPHKERYDLESLSKVHKELKPYIRKKPNGESTIDFAQAQAVTELNRALLKKYYHLKSWPLPEGYLCPGVPGRVDYLFHLRDLIGKEGSKKILDIGCGANLIYPIAGIQLFGWRFVASDIDKKAIANAHLIQDENQLKGLKILHQADSTRIFKGIVKDKDKFDACICNPPFYKSLSEALDANIRKNKNLKQRNAERNFKGQFNELVFKGGEMKFIQIMIDQSQHYAQQIEWFTTLVSQQKLLPKLTCQIKKVGGESQLIDMSLGNKKSRFLAWRF